MTKDQIFNFFGSAFYLGLSPVAPGTVAALVGVALHAVAAYLLKPELAPGFLFFAFVVVCALHYLLHDWAIEYWNDPDPGNFVMDEVAGYLIIPLMFPYGEPWRVMLFGFLLFRIIDIIKVPPAREVDQKMHNVWGVILDDWIAGVYAVLILYVMLFVGPLLGIETWLLG